MGRLSTHILDIAQGRAAQGVLIELFGIAASGERSLLGTARTDADGRTADPLLSGADFATGTYELCFHIGDYFRASGAHPEQSPFLDVVPVRFAIGDASLHYHVPLLCTPWSYSTYRGS